MSHEFPFSKDDILKGLRVLDEEEIKLKEPCTHRYRNLFPQMAQESVQAHRQGEVEYENFSEKYSYIFDEIYDCHPCVDEYLLAVHDADKTKPASSE